MVNMLGILVAAGICLALAGAAQGADALPASTQDELRERKEIYVATRRASGEWSAAAPVWFFFEDGVVYFTTSPDSHKGRRIRRGGQVRISTRGPDGPWLVGATSLVTDPALIEHLGNAYGEKYWIAWLGLFRPRVGRVASGKTLVVKVTPSDPTDLQPKS
ncbi:MAG: pyridoxamine 5'-phosphate oxidase family protein [Candidatus Binatia bacterium]